MRAALSSEPRSCSRAEPAVARYGVRIAAAVGIAIGGFWLAAWFIGWGAQWSAAGIVNPKTNVALGALLTGSAVLLLWPKGAGRTRRSAGAALAALVLLIGALTLTEHLFHYSLGIDQLLATESPGAALTTSPNRMGPPAAMCLTLLGIGALLLAAGRRKIAPHLGVIVCLICLVPAVGYLYGVTSFYGRPSLTAIAWPTLVALFSLGVGLVLAETENGPMAMLLRADAGGALLRRMAPAAVLVPLLLGFAAMQARHRELLDRANATGLLVIALAVIFSMLLWQSAAHLSRAEKEQARLASFPTLNPNPIAELDREGRVHFINPAARALFPDLEEKQGEHPWLAGWDSVVNVLGDGNGRVCSRDVTAGDRHYLQVCSYLPEAGRFRIYGLDITERVLAEAARRASEERFRVAQELSPDGFSILRPVRDSAGRVTDFIWVHLNAATARITGTEPHALMGQKLLTTFPGHRGSPLLQTYQEVAESGEARVCEALYEGDGGLSSHWFRVAVVSMGDDIAVLSQDITERKRAEQVLTRGQKTFSELVERAPFGIYIVDSQFRIAEMNVGSQNGAFRNVRPLIGRDFAEAMRILWPEPVAADIIAIFRHTLETGEPYYSPRFTNPRHDIGAVESYEWELHRMTLPDGQYGVICYYFDSTKLRQTEEALSRTAAFNQAAMTSLGEGLYTIDESGLVSFMNPAAERLFGWTFAELRGKKMHDITHHHHPDGSPFPSSECAGFQVLSHGKPLINHEDVFIRKDGTFFPVTYSISPMRDNTGKITGLAVVFRDVTAAKQAQEERQRLMAAVQQERDRLSALVNSITDEIWYADASGKLALINPAVWKEFGIAIGEMKEVEKIAASIEVYRPDGTSRPVEEAPPLRALRGETVVDQEEIVLTPSGQLRYRQVSAAPVRNPDGTIIGSVSVVRDITDRKQADEELRKSKERLDLAVEVAGLGEWDLDLIDHHASCSLRHDQIFGYDSPLPKWTYEMFLEHVLPEDRAEVDEKFQAALASGMWDFETRIRRLDGEVRWIWARGRVRLDEKGQPARMFGTVMDITERKRTMELLIRSEKVAALGRMAAGLAHDINNPLSAVMNTLFLARGNPECADCAHSVGPYLELADEELKRVSHITQQALGFYREGSTPTKVAIRTILDETVDIFRSKIKSKNVRVEKQYEGEVVEVVGIGGELRQMLSNLVANSLDAVEQDGIIKLRVTSSPDSRVRITIADDGKGIEPTAMPRIFEPLFTTKGSLGTGLGLWVTKQLVDKHGGSIRVHSSVNGRHRGTTFSVVLPGATAAREQTASA